MILLASALAHSSSQVLVQLCLVARLVLRLRLSLRPRRSLLGLVTDSCRTAAEPTPEVKEPRQLRELSSKAKRHSKVNRLLLGATPTREAATLVSSNRVRLLKDRDCSSFSGPSFSSSGCQGTDGPGFQEAGGRCCCRCQSAVSFALSVLKQYLLVPIWQNWICVHSHSFGTVKER
jgi:hypothetical protein